MNLNFAKLKKYSYLLLKIIIKNKEKNYYYLFRNLSTNLFYFWFIYTLIKKKINLKKVMVWILLCEKLRKTKNTNTKQGASVVTP